jgi:hypothetical protein
MATVTGTGNVQPSSLCITPPFPCTSFTLSQALEPQQTLSKSALEVLPTEILVEILSFVRKLYGIHWHVATNVCLKVSSNTLYKKVDVTFIDRLQHLVLDKARVKAMYLLERDWSEIPLTTRYVACGLCMRFHARTAFSSTNLQRPVFNMQIPGLSRRCIGRGSIELYAGVDLEHSTAMLGLCHRRVDLPLRDPPMSSMVISVTAGLRAINSELWTAPTTIKWDPYYCDNGKHEVAVLQPGFSRSGHYSMNVA